MKLIFDSFFSILYYENVIYFSLMAAFSLSKGKVLVADYLGIILINHSFIFRLI